MKLEDLKKLADSFFSEVSPDKIVKDFEKLGYKFSPSEELKFDLTAEAEGHFPIAENVSNQHVSHSASLFEDNEESDIAPVYVLAA